MAEEKSAQSIMREGGLKKIGERVTTSALDELVAYVKKGIGKGQVLLGDCFSRYLENAFERYNQVRTLATGTEVRSIIGPDSIYVHLGVRYRGRDIPGETTNLLTQVGKHILVVGSGGMGKSMLMRYLFLDSASGEYYVPILVELRKVRRQADGGISIPELVYRCLREFDAALPPEQFEYSLRLGKYLFLLDGFDEVPEALARDTAGAIQTFCSQYPKNPCVITTRPRRDSAPLETFRTAEALPLNAEQAEELARKIAPEDEKVQEFCRQLRESLYEQHRDFAENPLLLTMMLLTFQDNNTISDHLATFYQKAYDALYRRHDAYHKGAFRREFRSKSLDERQFQTLFAHFCFQSYFDEKYEFTRDEIMARLEQSIQKFGCVGVTARDYLSDLFKVVCLIVLEGEVYRFSHRSFQTYFAAWYAVGLMDVKQKRFYRGRLLRLLYSDEIGFFELAHQLDPHKFAKNALEEPLTSLLARAEAQPDPDWAFLRETTTDLFVDSARDMAMTRLHPISLLHYKYIGMVYADWDLAFVIYKANSTMLLSYSSVEVFAAIIDRSFLSDTHGHYRPSLILFSCDSMSAQARKEVARILKRIEDHEYTFHVTLSDLDTSTKITEDERAFIHKFCTEQLRITALRAAIRDFLDGLKDGQEETDEDAYRRSL